jgi:hypothetical protein
LEGRDGNVNGHGGLDINKWLEGAVRWSHGWCCAGILCDVRRKVYVMNRLKVGVEIVAIMLGVALLTYATIIWIYPKAIEIGILIGGSK